MSKSAKPKIIDLFAGVGGFSLGAIRAGFELAAAVDLDPHAIEAYMKNFPRATHARRDVVGLRGKDVRDLAKLNGHRLAGLIGGPPCQGFSTMGNRRKNDARNKLFFHFFRLVSEINPLFFVVENVPGILNEKYQALREESFRLVEKKYHLLPPLELCAADYGAATNRMRVFFIGWAKGSGFNFSETSFVASKSAENISVRVAFSGLPRYIDGDWQTEEKSWRTINLDESNYLKRINRIPTDSIGDENALKRFANCEVSGFLGTYHSPEVAARYAELKPGQRDSISRARRLEWDGLCPTIRAGTGPEHGSYQAVRPIHPSQNRVITPREAARLQGFPDWFQFSHTKWHSFRQIGNSIPPFMAEGVLQRLSSAIQLG